MAQPSARHERLVHRLAYILTQLFKGETLYLNRLASEFNVSYRTLLRDFNERLAHLDLEHFQGGYRLAGGSAVLRTDSDILQFANITHVAQLFPVLDRKLLSLLLNRQSHESPYRVYHSPPKALPSPFGGFAIVTQAILEHHFIHYRHEEKMYRWVAPYKLTYFDGVWYICGVFKGAIHAMPLLTLQDIEQTSRCFQPDNTITQQIEEPTFIQALPYFQYIKGILHPTHV
ncbi:transcriptional regulator [Providencia rettgeri]|uniref:transcriptional regulator n=1 Tax=Providencia rettgeri TaxID=587 RepID=UPI00236212B3|nr:transcriptional regulator [Providencia rettgeri]